MLPDTLRKSKKYEKVSKQVSYCNFCVHAVSEKACCLGPFDIVLLLVISKRAHPDDLRLANYEIFLIKWLFNLVVLRD